MNKKSGFYFTYNLEQVKVTRKVTVNFKDKTVPEVLDELFAKENIHYVINDKHIALYKGNDKQVVLQEILPMELLPTSMEITLCPYSEIPCW